MRLTIASPISLVVDVDDVSYVRAEDLTGAFGILPGHADFLTTLALSVLSYKIGDAEHHVAVRGGILTVREGKFVEVVTREAVGEDTLEKLGAAVLERMRAEGREGLTSRLASNRMEVAALKQIQKYLSTGSGRIHQGSRMPVADK